MHTLCTRGAGELARMIGSRQVTSAEVDRRLLVAVGEVSTLDIFDDAGLLDRLEILRVAKQPLANVISLFGQLISIAATLAVATGLLAVVDGRLAVLPILVIPVAAR